MVTPVFCALFFVVPSARTWFLFGCHFLFGSPVIAETNGGFDGIELMSSKDDAAYHREKVLDRHNYLRSREAENGFGGGAVFMNRLLYDVELEAYARNYARYLCATGKWEHSQRQAPLRVARGENLYTTSADYSAVPSQNFDSAKIVQKWWEEREYFDWHSSHPSQAAQRQGKLVGHWTQVVRAEASTVGCWIVTGCHCKGGYCGKQNSGRWSTYMACHYDYGNVGYYPYWPLNPNIQYRIPSSVPSSRRQRCGNCPKGFSACGTTVGGGQKRDAYLCVGHWHIRGASPPADLLQRSIQVRRSATGVPSWYYMVRNCVTNNGSCPSNSSCWKYEGGRVLTREPPILVNQCQCNGFSTRAGIYFERDFCGRYSMVQPYYDADAFLGFSELKVERGAPDAATASSPAPPTVLTYNRELSAKFRPRYRRRVPSEIEILNTYDYAASSYTPPLMEEADQAADLIIESRDTAPSSQTSLQHRMVPESSHSFKQDTSNELTTPKRKAISENILLENDVNVVQPPSDDLMFEWRGVLSPLSIAQKPAADEENGGSQHVGNAGGRLQNINTHNPEQYFVQVNDRNSAKHLQAEVPADEDPADEVPADEVPADEPDTVGRGESSTAEHPTQQAEETDAQQYQQSHEPDKHDVVQENLIIIPEGELEDQPSGPAGAPVDIPAVQLDARNRQMTPLDPSTVAASPAAEADASEPSKDTDEAETPPTLAGPESTSTGPADVSPQQNTGVEAPYPET